MRDLEQEQAEPFRLTPGFIAFLGALFMPVVLGLAIVIGAWIVSDEVYAAEAATARAAPGSAVEDGSEGVQGWKKSLVFICPLH